MGKGDSGAIIFPKCCFCIDLKTGVLVLGILSSIAVGIGMVAYIVQLAAFAVANGFSHVGKSPALDTALAMSIIGTIVFAIYFVASILLCVGASKGQPKLLIPWMILSGVNILWCLISIILLFAMPMHQYYDWGQFGSLVISILITIYFELVVLSLHNQFNDYDPRPQIA